MIDPRRTATAEDADLFLPIAPGMDAALFSGLLVHLADNGTLDRDYIESHTSGLRGRPRTRPRNRARYYDDRHGDRAERDRRRAVLRPVPRHAERRHLLLAGREPVGPGHRQGQRHHQLPSRHRPHRPAGHGTVLAHRPAQRHGRTRGRRSRQPACRPYGLHAAGDRPGADGSGAPRAWRSAKASRRCRCSRRSNAARSRRCG